MKCPVYIAASSCEHARAEAAANLLARAGITRITLDWWAESAEWAGKDARLDDSYASMFARDCDEAIGSSHIVWFLAGQHSRGAHNELGYARALRRHFREPLIVISGDCLGASIFYRADEVLIRRERDEDAAEDVLRLAREYLVRFEAKASVP